MPSSAKPALRSGGGGDRQHAGQAHGQRVTIGGPLQQGLTKNALVRQAINAVADVDEITSAMGRVSQRNHSLVYASSPYYQGDTMKAFYDRKSPAKAKELLAKAGYKGEQLTLQTNSDVSGHAQ